MWAVLLRPGVRRRRPCVRLSALSVLCAMRATHTNSKTGSSSMFTVDNARNAMGISSQRSAMCLWLSFIPNLVGFKGDSGLGIL